jgi:hypothetical protein
MLGNQLIRGLGISSIIRADNMNFFSVYVYHPQNSVALKNSPPMKLASSNFTFIDLDDMVGAAMLPLVTYLSSIDNIRTSQQ